MSLNDAVCAGQEVMFSCQLAGGSAIWTVNLPSGTISTTASSLGNNEGPYTFLSDPFGFTVHILSTSTVSSIHSELHVRAVNQLRGVQVSCTGLKAQFRAAQKQKLVKFE